MHLLWWLTFAPLAILAVSFLSVAVEFVLAWCRRRESHPRPIDYSDVPAPWRHLD
jgi:hypothetical protein